MCVHISVVTLSVLARPIVPKCEDPNHPYDADEVYMIPIISTV